MKSICFFSSYYNGENIPNYVKFYLTELSRHFPEIVFVTNEKQVKNADVSFLKEKQIQWMQVKNEGFDFGMWYKAFSKFNVINYDRICLVNDSCILFNKLDFYFDWLDKQEADYIGLTDCNLIQYHIQSYFIIINKKAIPHALRYFEMNGIITDMKQLIKRYEVGLTTYLIKSGMKVTAYFSYKDDPVPKNPSWMEAKNLIKAGYPLVKKKIIIRYYGQANRGSLIAGGFDPYPEHYIKLIRKAVPGINTDELLSGLILKKPFKEELSFQTIAIVSRIYGIFRRQPFIKMILRKNTAAFVPERKVGKVKDFIYGLLH